MQLSIIVPAYNEQSVIENDMEGFLEWLKQTFAACEVVLVENGSTDDTLEQSHMLAKKWPMLRIEHLDTANFGGAVKHGVMIAQGKNGILLNADWLDRDFITASLPRLQHSDIVIGSKVLDSKRDKRPFYRKIASKCLTVVLKTFFGFKFSDSHGLKAFRIPEAQKVMNECRLNEIIESEFLLLAEREGFRIEEIPVDISESRPPRISFIKRIFSMSGELAKMNKLRKRLDGASPRR